MAYQLTIFFSLISLCSLAFAEPARHPTCMTSECHNKLFKTNFRHSPIEARGCTVCHRLGNGGQKLPENHPKIIPIKKEDINKTCLVCHDEFGEKLAHKKFTHKALEKNGCTGCHDPHEANKKHLTKDEPPALCFGCHKELKESIENAKSHHSVVTEKEACSNCHEEHVSNRKNLLKRAEDDVCLRCHAKDIKLPNGATLIGFTNLIAQNPMVHKPVKGKCFSCHMPHGGKGEHLLDVTLPKVFHAKFETAKFSLCFDCHAEEIATGAKSKETEFRNGENNMHYLHLQRGEKSYNCLTCHAVHATKQPNLILDFTNYDGLQAPIKFVKTETGGTCTATCHGPRTYNREKEFKNEKGR